MLVVKYKKEGNVIESVTLSGHTEYENYGKDIVCASASSIFITTVNGILSIDPKSIEVSSKEIQSLENIKKDDVTNKLLNNMINLFIELSNDYEKNIKIMEE